MSLADLPDGFVTFQRDDLVARYKRDYALLNPEADVTTGQVDLDARLTTDTVLPFYTDARLIADGINEDAATGARLDRVGNRIGLPRPAATGASGYVSVTTSAGGAAAVSGDELENVKTKIRYQSAETKTVTTGDHVRVRAKTTGPQTDLDPGTILRWVAPRPGMGTNVTVTTQSDGRGLTGGSTEQSDARYLDGIRDRKRNPIGGDNEAELAAVIRETPDVPVEQVFLYPGAYGPGTTAFTFTVLAPTIGASRLATTAQLQAAFEWIVSQMPTDGNYFPFVATSQGLPLAFAVSWAVGGWADAVPWPATYAAGAVVGAVTGPLNFVINGSGTGPIVGSTIAVWDGPFAVFRRKKISAVTGTGPWTVTCTSDNAASDTTYTPHPGQRVSPWSDNLAAIPTPILAYLATLGPGEAFTPSGSFADGRRKLRSPAAPKTWPYAVGSKITVDLAATDEVQDATNLAGVGQAAITAAPPALLELSDLSVYPA